ncbi:MAG: DNA repair protein [Proteobacteria bacterium]|nr:DNA repair protein [Pseudomonadota bacterium]
MSHDLVSSLSSFQSSAAVALMVRDAGGAYRCAEPHEVLQGAQRLLAGHVRGRDMLSSPAEVKDFLRVRLGALAHEVFAVLHLNTRLQVLDYVEMFRGSLAQTSVYPREIVKDALMHNSAALILVHNHPSGSSEPSRSDEELTRVLKTALALVDVRVIDHLIVAGPAIQSLAERGLV